MNFADVLAGSLVFTLASGSSLTSPPAWGAP